MWIVHPRSVLIVSTVAVSWLGMQAVHEFGHVLHAWLSGGSVEAIVLHPLAISRTDVDPNPHPLFVVWGGPFWGCLLPLGAYALARFARLGIHFLTAFFAGFSLIANGAYLGSAVVMPAGDAADLLRYGSPLWQLVLFSALTIPAGFRLWHGLGRHFGIGPEALPVEPRVAWGMLLLLVVFVAGELAYSAAVLMPR